MDFGILSQVVSSFEAIEIDLYLRLASFARMTFYLFAVFEVLGVLLRWSNQDGQGWTALLSTLLPLLVLQTLLINYQFFIVPITSFFGSLGLEAAGVGSLSPGSVLNRGFVVALKVFLKLGAVSPSWLPGGTLIRLVPSIVVLAAFGLAAVKLMQVLAEQHLALGLGVLFLGFGSSRWTWGLAKGFLGWLVELSIRVMLYLVILGTTTPLIDQWIGFLSTAGVLSFIAVGKIVATAIGWAYIVWSLPERVARQLASAWTAELGNPYR